MKRRGTGGHTTRHSAPSITSVAITQRYNNDTKLTTIEWVIWTENYRNKHFEVSNDRGSFQNNFIDQSSGFGVAREVTLALPGSRQQRAWAK